jgi:YHS domain-containing protein
MKSTKLIRVLFLSALLSLAVGTVAVLAHEQPATRPTTLPTTRPGTPVNKFCPVEPENEVDPKVTVVYKGKIIGFCCADCIKDFNKDPEKYVKNLK